MITISSLRLQKKKEREKHQFMTLVILKVGHPAAVHSHVQTALSMCF